MNMACSQHSSSRLQLLLNCRTGNSPLACTAQQGMKIEAAFYHKYIAFSLSQLSNGCSAAASLAAAGGQEGEKASQQVLPVWEQVQRPSESG